MTDTPKPQPATPETLCTTCHQPIARYATAVAHHSPRGVTIEHQACWQSRTFGGDRGPR